MKFRLLMFLCAVLMFSAFTEAGTLPVPQLRNGQFVYVIPDNFDPPLIGPSGLNELNQQAQKLHFPFYVVLVENLDGTGSAEEMAAAAIEGLAQDWAEKYSSFDLSKSQIFLLSYQPRQFRFLAGMKFISELGFEHEATQRYLDKFLEYAKGSPSDPKSGILAVMTSVDEHLFEETDPVMVAQKLLRQANFELNDRMRAMESLLQEKPYLPTDVSPYQGILEDAGKVDRGNIEAVSEMTSKLGLMVSGLSLQISAFRDSTSNLHQQASRLTELLEKKNYLPADISKYQKLLEKAKSVDRKNLDAMRSLRTDIQDENQRLEKYIAEQKRKAKMEALHNAAMWLLRIAIVAGIIAFFVFRIMRLQHLRKVFAEKEKNWRAKISNAAQKYVQLYGERENILEMISNKNGISGRTKKLFEETTAEIDAIYIAVSAMESHINRLAATAKQSTIFKLKLLEKTIDSLEKEFEYETDEQSYEKLFEKVNKTVKVSPEQFEKELEDRFKKSVSNWQDLQKAAEVRLVPMEETLPHEQLNELFAKCKENNINDRWIAGHPLYGDDTSDQSFYQKMNSLRESDPVAYLEELREVQATEKKLVSIVETLVGALKLIKLKRVEQLPMIIGVCVDAEDDPAVTLNAAREAEAKMAGLINSAENFNDVLEQTQATMELYRKTSCQIGAMQQAQADAADAIKLATKDKKEAEQTRAEASKKVEAARKIHAKVDATDLENGDSFMTRGGQLFKRAMDRVGESRHLNAMRNAGDAADQFKKAGAQFGKAIEKCQKLDALKAEYEEKLANAEEIRKKYQKKIKGYGGSANLKPFQPSTNGRLMDYVLLLSLYNQMENSWQSSERSARQSYEAEQARIRQREEAEARERRRRQQSYSSSHSSGSSWGGGSSHSSGGSWGGGGGHSSGGSW